MVRMRADSRGSVVWTVARKELREALRDRQTALTTLVLPLCMYPLLFWVMVQGALVVQGYRESQEVVVGFAGAPPPGALEALGAAPQGNGSGAESGLPTAASPGVDPLRLEPVPGAPEEAVLRAALEDPALGLDAALGFGAEGVLLLFDGASPHGELAERRVRERLGDLRGRVRAEALEAAGHDPRVLNRLELESVDLGDAADKGALALATILPLILATWCFLGAFFPAIDLSAGERERSTLETTRLLPVPRRWVLEGKVLAVASLAILATLANLVAIALSAEGLLAQIDPGGRLLVAFPTVALLAAAPMVALFALFCAALLTAFAGLARNFREAQASLGPLQLVFVLPAMAAILPGVELTPLLALVPVLGVTLAVKSLILGQALLLEYALTIAGLLVYAAAALSFSVRMMSREGFATASDTIGVGRALRMFRSSRAISR
jgi:sodium transport system permease protein